jgi:hypothetical protein
VNSARTSISTGAILVLSLLLAGCTQGAEKPQPPPPQPVAPITALQVGDLLSDKVQDRDGNLFITVEPKDCSGMALEVDPPLIFNLGPAATDGGHWVTEDGRNVVIDEAAGVYPANFDPQHALAETKRTIDSCRNVPFTVTDMRGREYHFRLLPQVDSGSPDIVLYSFAAPDWACDNAFTAAHNAAVRISTCATVNGYDVLSLARDALKRIEMLANTTA